MSATASKTMFIWKNKKKHIITSVMCSASDCPMSTWERTIDGEAINMISGEILTLGCTIFELDID